MEEPLTIKVDKNGGGPMYRQIIERITTLIQKGELKPGDKLPPERELARQIGAARGTVAKAYEQLVRDKIIENSRGRGTFVAMEQDVLGEGRKEKAVRMIHRLLGNLERMKFTHQEISPLIQIIMMEREKRLENFHVAAVDCNPESLAIFEKQLMHITRGELVKFLLDDLYNDPDAKRKLSAFDLILTTPTHHSELAGLLKESRDKIVRAAVSPSQQTVIDLASIPPSARIGVLTKSPRFFEIIRDRLRDFRVNPSKISGLLEKDLDQFDEFVKDKNALIAPPTSPLDNMDASSPQFRSFLEGGGVIVRFAYQIERGTLMVIEEKVSELLNGRTGEGKLRFPA